MRAVCGGCLSVGRAVSRAPPALHRSLASILDGSSLVASAEYISDVRLCWECAALLRKTSQFKARVCRAQQWLQARRSGPHSEVTKVAVSLSALKSENFPTIEITRLQPDLLEHGDTEHGMQTRAIKLEPEVGRECFEDADEKSDMELCDIEVNNFKILHFEVKPDKQAIRKKRLLQERSRRKGLQYGYMYDKLRLSEAEMWRMRMEETAEARFASAAHKCDSCIVAFRSGSMLKKHQQIQHSEKFKNSCKVCSKRFGTKSERDRHHRSHYFCYKCKKCALVFLERDMACRHYKKDDHNDPEKCDAKSEALKTSSSEFIKHPSIHKDYRCHICNKMFTLKGNFTKHITIHNRKLKHKCNICNKSFKKTAYLTSHMLIHSGDKPHNCDVCNKKFSLKANLKQHLLVHTLERRHQCEICSRCFSQRGTLKQHMVTHTGEKAFKCEVCSKSFTMKQYLKQHMLFHTGELPHQCDICSKRFGLKSKLDRHMLIHSGGKPYQCTICKKSFAYKATLKQHMILHTFEPKHQCGVCKKCFTQAKSLRLHTMIHTGERPYGCEVCGKRFAYEQALQRHMFTHTGEQPHGCDICGKRFSLKANLKMHITKVHKVEQIEHTQFSLEER